MAESFTEKVIDILQQIPSGRVTTYGRVARMAGNPRGARQVVRILHSSSGKYNLPWHRVINRFGEIPERMSMFDAYQKTLLEEEGVEVTGMRVDLQRYLWENRVGGR